MSFGTPVQALRPQSGRPTVTRTRAVRPAQLGAPRGANPCRCRKWRRSVCRRACSTRPYWRSTGTCASVRYERRCWVQRTAPRPGDPILARRRYLCLVRSRDVARPDSQRRRQAQPRTGIPCASRSMALGADFYLTRAPPIRHTHHRGGDRNMVKFQKPTWRGEGSVEAFLRTCFVGRVNNL